MTDVNLPTYDRPPLVETILSVQFDRLHKLTGGHLGAFWSKNEVDWPRVTDAPPVDSEFEQFTEEDRWRSEGLRLRLETTPQIRLRARNAGADRMLQLQSDRFLLNWLKAESGEYPRYEATRSEFARQFERFTEFVSSRQLGEVTPNQWELTYLNQIPRGSVWNSSVDWSFFRPMGQCVGVEGMTELESFSGQWHFQLPEKQGRLHISWQHGRRRNPSDEVIVLNLTARGPVSDRNRETSSVLQGLDLGRTAIVKTFESLMSDAANQYWGLRHGT